MSNSKYTREYHTASVPSPGVLLLEFNRTPVNAFNDAMWEETRNIMEDISFDPDLRVVVLASSLEKYFTAGLDLAEAGGTLGGKDDLDPARRAFLLNKHLVDFQGAISSFQQCRLPVVVALHGACLGLAIDIASACDVRLAASNATFAIAEVNVGLAADIGTLQRFPKIIGNDSKAREFALTGRRFDAEEAKQVGFVSEVIQGGRQEVVDAAVKLATEIAQKSPIAAVSTKHLMNHARDHTIQEGLDYTAAWNMSMLQAADTGIAMRATLKRQTPKFPSLRPDVKAKL